MSARNRLLLIPAAGAAAAACAALLAVLVLTALLGSASAGASCTPTSAASVGAGVPERLRPIFDAAARRYGLGPQGPSILAGLTSVESGFGQNMGPSSAGAIGWTQFLPSTWAAYGVDANGNGRKDPYTAEDAIFASARYLQASGAPEDWHRALFAYNHADWYVTKVLDRARELSTDQAPIDHVADSPETVLIVGDSLSVGTTPELHSLTTAAVTSDAVTGRTSTAGITVVRRLLSSQTFDVVVFDLGTNDASARQLARSLRELTQLTKAHPVVVATVNSPFDERAKNTLLRRYASTEPNVTLVDWHEESERLALSDGIHGGYTERAELLANALSPPSMASSSCASVSGSAAGVARINGGGRLVAIPGQAGQLIDGRIVDDVVYLIDTYRITITSGYDLTGHAANGEHPLGLALDIVPGPAGSWDDVDRLARWAEPTPGSPRPPFRWVGYDGDANHGRGHHLHLSWNHGSAPGQRPPAAWVDTLDLTR